MQITFKSLIQKNDKIILLLICILLLITLFFVNGNLRKSLANTPADSNAIFIATAPKIIRTVSIADLHLFGQAENNLNLPHTALQLSLQGVVFSKNNLSSLAIISSLHEPPKIYHQGQMVPGGAIIKIIERDRVVLEENHQLASLNLPIHKLPAENK